MAIPANYLIVGGAGFIGSHFVDKLLSLPETKKVTVLDNFSSGSRVHLKAHQNNSRLSIQEGDAADLPTLEIAMQQAEAVIHLASNPDLAKAQFDPDIDFRQGTILTRNILEAMRKTNTTYLLYASGSGVYGDCGTQKLRENYGPLLPISPYGASKLAGEALISSYCHMFGIRAIAFRFANVIGPRQTHGVGFDFLRRLRQYSQELLILGDGRQSKPYIDVTDVIEAVWLAFSKSQKIFDVFNISTEEALTVLEIAQMACATLNLSRETTQLRFSGGQTGWKGDVPIVRLDSTKIRSLGWRPKFTSQEAMRRALIALRDEGQNPDATPQVNQSFLRTNDSTDGRKSPQNASLHESLEP